MPQTIGPTLDFVYVHAPNADARCGSANDTIRWVVSGTIPKGNHAIVQMVRRTANIERSGKTPIKCQELFYELWDVIVDGSGTVTMMANVDEFSWHDKAGDDTKGSWEITGVARFIPNLDVVVAIASGEPWMQGPYSSVSGVGRLLYVSTNEPKDWTQYSGEVARVLKAEWNCYPNETRIETDVSGSGRTSP